MAKSRPANEDLNDLVITRYPLPMALPFRKFNDAIRTGAGGAAAWNSLISTFESLLHFLALVTLGAHVRTQTRDQDRNQRILAFLREGKPTGGAFWALLRDLLRASGAWHEQLLYAELPGQLFDGSGKPAESFRQMERFVEIRNNWAHGGSKSDDSSAGLLENNRGWLEEELGRWRWLTSVDLIRPLKIVNDQIVGADILMGERPRRREDYRLRIASSDVKESLVRPEQGVLLASRDRSRYLPLSPLLLFDVQPNSKEGVLLLQSWKWDRSQPGRLASACHIAYEAGLQPREESGPTDTTRYLQKIVEQLGGFPAPLAETGSRSHSEIPRKVTPTFRVADLAPAGTFVNIDEAVAVELEKLYLNRLANEILRLCKQGEETPIVQVEAWTKKLPRKRKGWLATLFRHSPSDYATNPALSDLELSVRHGFGKRVRIKNLVKELRYFSKIVVLGDPGSGKSVCLRQLAYDLANRELKRRGRPTTLPVLVDMGTYDACEVGPDGRIAPLRILEFLRQSLRGHEAVREAPTTHPNLYVADNLETLLQQGRLTCIFDALDEMPRESYPRRYEELKRFMNAWGDIKQNNRFVYSCRHLDYDSSFSVDEVLIEPFHRHRIHEYLTKHVPEAADALFDEIVEDESIEEFVSNPFFLHALAYINKGSTSQKFTLPKTRGELISKFVDQLLKREAEEKQADLLGNAGGREALFRLLADLGFLLQQRREGGTSVQTDSLKKLWETHPRWQDLLWIARRARILGKREREADEESPRKPVDRTPPERVEFIHHRLQEYFAAYELARLLGEQEPVERYLEDIWWQETVILAVGIVKSPQVILRRMLARRPETDRWINDVAVQAEAPISDENLKDAQS